MSTLASPLFQYADAQNITGFQEIIEDMEPLTQKPNQLNAFYPIFLIIVLTLFMMYALKTRHDREKYGMIFAIAAAIISVVLTLIFIAPVDFVFFTEQTNLTIIQAANGTMQSITLNQSNDNAVLLSKDNQFRFIFVAFFTVFSFFNGLLAIRILSGW